MKILVVSDTHGRLKNYWEALEREKPHMVLHLGDVERQEDEIMEFSDCPVKIVAGNNDYFSRLNKDIEFSLYGKKIWMTHGHVHRVNQTRMFIRQEAGLRKVDIALFGHTHYPEIREEDGILIACPGSISMPRQADRRPSYLVLNISGTGEVQCVLRYLE